MVSVLPNKQVCVECGHEKPIESFAIKSSKCEATIRRDKRCKPCKSMTMKRSAIRKVQAEPLDQTTPKRIIELKKSEAPRAKSVVFETSQIVGFADFDGLEKFYGNKLDGSEKHEIVERLNEFIGLMRDGLGEILGCDVYVSEDQ